MSKIIVGVDLDSTLNKLEDGWLEVYNRDYNDNLTVNDMTQWDWTTATKPECGKKVYDYLRMPGFFASLGIKERSQEVTEWLVREKNCEIFVVTAYVPEALLDKYNWIVQNFPHIPSKNIMFVNDKGTFNGDFLIDDGAHNAIAFSENSFGTPILLDRPWNQHVGNRFERVHDWTEIEKYFREVLP